MHLQIFNSVNKAFLIFIFLIIFTNQFVFSQEDNKNVKNPILANKFQLGVGMFLRTQKVKFSVDGFSENDLINFDKNFDFNHNQVRPQFTFDWRFVKKWKLSAEYFDASYSKTQC